MCFWYENNVLKIGDFKKIIGCKEELFYRDLGSLRSELGFSI